MAERKSYIEVAARVPVPTDFIEANKLQGKVLAVAEEFRTKILAFGKTEKIEGIEFSARRATTKGPKAAKEPAVGTPATTAPQPGPVPETNDAGGAPAWADKAEAAQ